MRTCRLIRIPTILAFTLLIAGCVSTSLEGDVDPNIDMANLNTFYVLRQPKDDKGIEKLIAAELQSYGKNSSYGNDSSPPEEVDAVVTYIDKWMWDITMYLLELTIEVRDPKTNYIFAKGHSYRTSLARRSPEAMVEEVLSTIFTGKKEGAE